MVCIFRLGGLHLPRTPQCTAFSNSEKSWSKQFEIPGPKQCNSAKGLPSVWVCDHRNRTNRDLGSEGGLGLRFERQFMKPLFPQGPHAYAHRFCIRGWRTCFSNHRATSIFMIFGFSTCRNRGYTSLVVPPAPSAGLLYLLRLSSKQHSIHFKTKLNELYKTFNSSQTSWCAPARTAVNAQFSPSRWFIFSNQVIHFFNRMINFPQTRNSVSVNQRNCEPISDQKIFESY